MIGYNDRSLEEAVIHHLERISGPSLTQFENFIKNIHTYYKLIGRKRSTTKTGQIIELLESSKEDLVNRIAGYLKRSDSWRWIKNTYIEPDDIEEYIDPDEQIELDEETKREFIRTNFHLQYYFDFVDRRIAQLNRTIRLIKSVDFHTEDKQKRVQPHTMAVLVWLTAFKDFGLSDKKSCGETRALWKWFSRNRKQLLEKNIGYQISIRLDAITRDFERYILNPNDATRPYKEMAEELYSYTFHES